MDLYTTGIYRENRLHMIAMGLWPETKKSNRILILGSFYALIWSVALPEWKFLNQPGTDLDDYIAVMVPQTVIMTATTKITSTIFSISDFQDEMDRIIEDWVHLQEYSADAVKIMESWGLLARLGTKIYSIGVFGAAALYFLVPLSPILLDVVMPLNESRQKAFAMEGDYSIYGIDKDKFYYGIIFHNFMIGMFIAEVCVSVDMFILINIFHCCGLFEVVGFLLKGLEDEPFTPERTEKIYEAVRLHNRGIELAEMTGDSFTIMYGGVVLFNMILVSVCAVGTMTKIGEPSEMARYALLTLGCVAHLAFLSLPGQALTDNSIKVADTVYDCHWYELDNSEKKIIQLMMMRGAKALTMSAGNFYTMNLENFKSVLQTSVSYFTMMLSFHDEEQ